MRPTLPILAAALALALPATASAVTVSKAQLSGGQLRVEGGGTAAGLFVTASSPEGSAGARGDAKGAFKIQADGFRASDCQLRVSDGRTATAVVRLAGCTPVAPAPIPTPPPAPSGTCTIDAGQPGSFALGDLSTYFFTTTGCQGGPLQWRLLAGQLPPGFDQPTFQGQTAGSVGGRAVTEGTYSFTVGATDAAGQTAARTFTVTITPARPVTITNPSALPGVAVGQVYQENLLADGGLPSYAFALVAGQLPPGLSLSTAPSVPSLFGQPTTRGTFTFTLRASDSRGSSGTRTLTLTVS